MGVRIPLMKSTLAQWIVLAGFMTISISAATEDTMNPPNRLINEQSPYLLQHAHNPVDWFPWGDEAFEKAKSEGKLVLLSVGYSTCHWCHVMNRESFSDPEIAAYLNEHYVCIKVDREERPDVDRVYMNFVQQLTGSGGWPMNVWLTSDRKPFYGGTYFPPEPRFRSGNLAFPEILSRIQKMWQEEPENILTRSDKIVETLNDQNSQQAEGSDEISFDVYEMAIQSFSSNFDPTNGGFGGAPKFPSPANLSFLLRSASIKELPEDKRAEAKRMALRTLEAIAKGGIRDHIGGGFHRYSVDGEWSLPHFEKMLYDQALLAIAYIEAWQVEGKNEYKKAATTTLDYALRDMHHEAGGFYSAEDAESYAPENPSEKREGAFYVWRYQEFLDLFGEEKGKQLANYLGAGPSGNAPGGPFHTEELDGYNTLRTIHSIDEFSQRIDLSKDETISWIQNAEKTLFQERAKRQRPHLDDKIIVSWNGMTISALSKASMAFGESEYRKAAEAAAQFIRENLYDGASGRLIRLFRESKSDVFGFAEDYAYLIQGLLDLYEAGGDPAWLEWAYALQLKQNDLFYDVEEGGYFDFEKSDEIVFEPMKEDFDGATPTASSVSAKNLARLGQIMDDDALSKMAITTIRHFLPSMRNQPQRLPALLDAMAFVVKNPIQIVIAGDPSEAETQALIQKANITALPNRVLLFADGSESQDFLKQRLAFFENIEPIDGKPTAFVCENFVCQLPVNTVDALGEQLAALLP